MSQHSEYTPERFIKKVEGYYGPYRPYMKVVVLDYLRREGFPSEYLRRLWEHLVYCFSTEYRNIPDVAVLERMCREVDKEPIPFKPVALIEEDPETREERMEEVEELLKGLVGKLKAKERV